MNCDWFRGRWLSSFRRCCCCSQGGVMRSLLNFSVKKMRCQRTRDRAKNDHHLGWKPSSNEYVAIHQRLVMSLIRSFIAFFMRVCQLKKNATSSPFYHQIERFQRESPNLPYLPHSTTKLNDFNANLPHLPHSIRFQRESTQKKDINSRTL